MLNRPEALNALSMALRNRIAEVFDEIASDGQTEVVILSGTGRAFTVGLDLKELGGEVDATAQASSRDLSAAIGALNVPVIGAVNGFAITGGFELALMCDFLIASPEARFADTHARVGVVPGWGLSQRLPRLIGINRAKELSLTGNYLDAEKAERWGLVNHVYAADELLPAAKKLAHEMASCDPVLLCQYKQVIDDGFAIGFGDAQKLEVARSAEHAAGVTAEGVEAARQAVTARGRTLND